MKATWILAGILLFLLLLCSIPISIRFRLGALLQIDVRICGIRILTLPPPVTTSVDLRKFTYKRHRRRLRKEARKREKRRLAEEAKSKKEQTKSKARKMPRLADAHQKIAESDDGLREMLPFLLAALDTIPKFFGRMECVIRKLHVTVGGDDAAQAAIRFGVLSQSAAYLLEILDCRTRLQPLADDALRVCVDYTAPRTAYDVDFTLTIRPVSILHTGVDMLTAWIRRMKKS